MDVYGLTGGIGSGKSTVASLLEEYGVPVVSADELSRIVVSAGSPGLQDVVEEFGRQVLQEDGGLDRAKLASIVFADPERRRRLEEILHPRIRERYEQVLDALEKAGHEVAVYEVPLLFEKNLQGDMKAVMLVTAPDAVRVRRVCTRDNVTETEVRARIAAQMPEEQKRRRADYIIENDGNVDALRREVEFLLARFLRVSGVVRRGPASEAVEAVPQPIDHGPSLQLSAPSRAPTEIPTHAPVRTGETLPPPGGPARTAASASTTLAAGAVVQAATRDDSRRIRIDDAPAPGSTLPSTPVVGPEETEATPAVAPELASPPDTTPAVNPLSTPPQAPPLRRPTDARTAAPPAPPSKPPTRGRPTDDLKKKPTAPPLTPPTGKRTRPPAPPTASPTPAPTASPTPSPTPRGDPAARAAPPATAPPPAAPPRPTMTAKQTVVGPAPPSPPRPASGSAPATVVPPPPPRTQTERVAVISPAAAGSDDEPT